MGLDVDNAGRRNIATYRKNDSLFRGDIQRLDGDMDNVLSRDELDDFMVMSEGRHLDDETFDGCLQIYFVLLTMFQKAGRLMA